MCAGSTLSNEIYDAVIIGTGLVESILSAALSFSGARVLHLDPNDFYGSRHATLSLSKVAALRSEYRSDSASDGSLSGIFEFGVEVSTVEDVDQSALRHVSVDLAPRSLLAAGPLIDIFVQTGVGHYLSFRPLDATYLYISPHGSREDQHLADRLQKVPASRSDVFQNRFLSMVEKRLLMRFIGFAAPTTNLYNSGAETAGAFFGAVGVAEEDTFQDLMGRANLTATLQQFLKHSIVFSEDLCPEGPESISADEGCKSIGLYMKSLARYRTPTPLLYPNYGCGEICEALCRLSAVHGGVFALRRGIERFTGRCEADNNEAWGSDSSPRDSAMYGVETTEGEGIRATCIFASRGVLPGSVSTTNLLDTGRVWRYICLLESSAFDASTPRALAIYPQGVAGNTTSTVRVQQMDSSAEVCPEGYFLLYAETVGSDGRREDLVNVLSTMVELSEANGNATTNRALSSSASEDSPNESADNSRRRPRVLWSACYARRHQPRGQHHLDVDEENGVVLIPDAPVEIDTPQALSLARQCFMSMRPANDFFPRQMSDTRDGNEEND